MKLFSRRTIIIIIFITVSVMAVVATAASAYFYSQYKTSSRLLQTGMPPESSEITSLISTISTYMELPLNETPTLATVSDTTKLPAIPLFAKAKNGDKILIFPQNTKAIVYRPSTKKIIEVAVFSAPGTPKVTNTSDTPAPKKPTVVVRNGTSTSSITSVYEKSLLEKNVPITIIDKDIASRKNYQDTMIVPLTTLGKTQVSSIARLLDIPVAPFPTGEASSTADLLIIVGSDFTQK